jgi:GNAT superfamily N-acetyltransferase
MEVTVRSAEPAELDRLAEIWHRSWMDAHESLLPAELARLRTRESFRARLEAALEDTRVSGPAGEPVGFCTIREDELYQLFMAASARGTGVAAALLRDAELRLAARGVTRAWLACAIGNQRGARFYEKHGWTPAGVMTNRLETSHGEFLLEVWRYEKALVAA